MASTEVGAAHISIFPQMDKSFAPKCDQAAQSAGDSFGAKFGGVAKAAVAAAGLAAVGKAAADFTTAALSSYANYEQLVGGVDKLYGDASGKLQQYAAEAYATAGMSSAQYMEQATSFSAALVSSMGGDVDAAADMTDVAMRAISDNVNVFGSDMQSVQDAYQGFAKQNYTMLDNLKLGYGGTKSEMERLIADANAYAEANGLAADLSIDNFGDIVQAIQYIQEEQGIAGTTAKEASQTISGSIEMTKAAWANLLQELGNPDGDVAARVGELVDSAVTAAGNIIPAVIQIGKGVAQAVPAVLDEAAAAVRAYAPTAIEEAVNGAERLIEKALWDIFPFIQLPRIDGEQAFASLSEAFETAASEASRWLSPLRTVFADVVRMVAPLGENVQGLLGPVGAAFGSLYGDVHQVWVGITGVVRGAVQEISPYVQQIGDIVQEFITRALPVVQGFASMATDLITGVIIPAVNATVDTLSNVLGPVLDTIQANIGPLYDSIAPFMDALQNAAAVVIPALHDAFQGAFAGIQTVIDTVMPYVQSAIDVGFQAIKDVFAVFTAALNGDWSGCWTAILTLVSNVLSGIWNGIVTPAMSGIGQTVGAALDAVKGFFSDKLNAAKSAVTNALSAIASGFREKLNVIKTTVGGIFESVKNIIGDKINSARQKVSDGISRIKSLFSNLTLSLPHIKVPHFHISGGTPPYGIGGAGTKPSISITWAAKGGIVDGATLIGAGEAGKEAIMPLQGRNMRPFAQAVAAHMDGGEDADRVVRELQAMRRDMANMKLYLDGRALVGGIAGRMDAALGARQAAAARGF
ncbi:Phage-related protein [Slackia heliotrinireducens]|uniref:Phage-related protein n=1 Tax=Slackia heliotrinireducens (strain ATCC 29202 / DSM 20476 / NCTC 11029 / RHS 1) TaxID=471855 RepID=C7N6N1_SLAHD|nr:hypothetical protein [Slackia heliotrinireducens]ACV22566.1 hypothetical protein Shel_15470 [Slackia heliotrinireducens DSM 20476]VEH01043.1 Phage-related protein [Slackia heliotrinireducens]